MEILEWNHHKSNAIDIQQKHSKCWAQLDNLEFELSHFEVVMYRLSVEGNSSSRKLIPFMNHDEFKCITKRFGSCFANKPLLRLVITEWKKHEQTKARCCLIDFNWEQCVRTTKPIETHLHVTKRVNVEHYKQSKEHIENVKNIHEEATLKWNKQKQNKRRKTAKNTRNILSENETK